MRWKGWDRVKVDPDSGKIVNTGSSLQGIDAIAPLLISASRSTDIPALYGEWFMERLDRGYVTWKSPFDGKVTHVSFANARVFVFWSKNPAPFLPSLQELWNDGRQFIILFTLNDYCQEGFEPGIPELTARIRTFRSLSERFGRERLTWRFDPLVVSDSVSVPDLLERIGSVGDKIASYAGRLIVSFIDIGKYPRVRRNLAAAGITGIREFSDPEIQAFASGLAELNRDWDLPVQACGEGIDLSQYGIDRGECISYELLANEFPGDSALMEFLQPPENAGFLGKRKRELKDPGQRSRCGCIVSKDIGRYSTCIHGCRYCYATSSQGLAERHYRDYCRNRDKGIFFPGIIG